MCLDTLQHAAHTFLQDCPENHVREEDALRPELTWLRIFDMPIFGVASAEDPLFRRLQDPGVLAPGARLPCVWLPQARSVLAFFLPFTQAVRQANRLCTEIADEWLHARIEGQIMVDRLGNFLCQWLGEQGHAAVYPASSEDFRWLTSFSSNWSERHVAYICGLGTFGLSKGLITKKGVAGRFGSVVTSAPLPVTRREYDSPFAYCTMCGQCAKNCPPHAIDPEKGVIHGKNHAACSAFLNEGRRPPHGPNRLVRYGCGKCQVGVPCESRIPAGLA